MPSFRYTGRDMRGARVSGALEGASADAVASELISRQITPLTIDAERAQADSVDVFAVLREKLRRKRVDLDELIIFSRQMYSLNKAGNGHPFGKKEEPRGLMGRARGNPSAYAG